MKKVGRLVTMEKVLDLKEQRSPTTIGEQSKQNSWQSLRCATWRQWDTCMMKSKGWQQGNKGAIERIQGA